MLIRTRRYSYDADLLAKCLRGRLVHHCMSSTWYEYVGTHYEVLPQTKLLSIVEAAIKNVVKDVHTNFEKGGYRNWLSDTVRRLCARLELTPDMRRVEPGMNFKNGYLSFERKALLPHNPDVFLTSVLDVEYKSDEVLSEDSVNFLRLVTQGNTKDLAFLRICLFLGMCPQPECQVGFVLSGPPSSGKSLWISILTYILGPLAQAFELRDFTNPFARFNMRGLHLLCFAEVGSLTQQDADYIKRILGRDGISSHKKFDPTNYTDMSIATLVMSTNLSPSRLIGDKPAIWDRLVNIRFHPYSGPPDGQLGNKLRSNVSGLINWGLGTPLEGVRSLVRAGHLNAESTFANSPMLRFISQKIAPTEKGRLYHEVLFKQYIKYLAKIGEPTDLDMDEFINTLIEDTEKYFNYRVVSGNINRGKKGRPNIFKNLQLASLSVEPLTPPPFDT